MDRFMAVLKGVEAWDGGWLKAGKSPGTAMSSGRLCHRDDVQSVQYISVYEIVETKIQNTHILYSIHFKYL